MTDPARDRDARGAWLDALLARAVAAGTLDEARAAALRALAREPDGSELDVGRDEAPAPRGGPHAVAVAYALGAGLLVLAMAWFVADRWTTLGPRGVLAVAAGYAALFATAARALAGRRFALGAGVATLLAACTAPLAAWAVLRLLGLWPAPPVAPQGPWLARRLLALDLSALAAALGVLRLVPPRMVRRDPVTALAAVAGGFALGHLAEVVIRPPLWYGMDGWVALAVGGVLLSAALAVDARLPSPAMRREDHARWLHVAAIIALHLGLLQVWSELGPARHVMPSVAVALLALGVRLRRRSLLAVGALDALGYVAWLAFELFRATLGFPFALAAAGAAVIGGAVLAQRRWPALVRGGPPVGARALPGGWATILAPAALGLALLPVAAVTVAPTVVARIQRNEQAPPQAPVRTR
jgi:hypothetical protein